MSNTPDAAAHTDDFMRIDSADDFARAKASRKIGIIPGVQNSGHFRMLNDVDSFYGIGQRISQLTYNARNMYVMARLNAATKA